jgi:hypothetical protein
MNVPFYYWLHEQPYDYYRYTEYALRRFARQCALDIVRLDRIGGTPEILADLFAKNIRFIPLLGKSMASVIQCIAHFFVKTKLGKKISRKTSESFPLGYFLVVVKRS